MISQAITHFITEYSGEEDELQRGDLSHPAHPLHLLSQLFTFSHCAEAIKKEHEGRIGYMLFSS
jgi:hypothetical protein